MQCCLNKNVGNNYMYVMYEIYIYIYFLFVLSTDVTTVTVGDVQAAEDNVFTTTVATSESLPEHMLVDNTH